MKIKTRNGKQLLTVLLLIVCLIGLTMTFMLSTGTMAFAEEQYEDKVYCSTTINEDFAENCVLVVMDKYHSKLNKKFGKEFFDGLPIKSVTDLMATDKTEDELAYLDVENFRQILKLELEEPSKQNVLDIIHSLERKKGVLSASPSHSFQNYALPSCLTGSRYEDLWGLHGECGIYAEFAWEIKTGRSAVRVGIIDTGVDSHSDLTANLAEGWNVLSKDTVQNDTVGHGTHIAGTIGAKGNNENGIVGVARNVTLVPIQAATGLPIPLLNIVIPLLNEETCVSAIEWAIENDIDIINFSIGSYLEPLALKAAISNFTGLFVCAAGNGKQVDNQIVGVDTDVTPHYPSSYTKGETFSNRIISVGAIDSTGEIAYFSNYGATTVDIFAPGANILSTVPTSVASDGYAYFDGTSMATPHVVGVAALLWSKFLGNEYYGNPFGLNRSDIAVKVKETILENVMTGFNGYCVSGGRLNAYMALKYIPYRKVMSGFGYSSGIRNWIGEVDILVDRIDSFYLDSSEDLVFTKSTDVQFSVGTNSVYNTWKEITGNLTYTLKNSADEIVQIEGNDAFSTTFKVGLISNATYTNRFFTINTKSLPNDTYTLYLSCKATRDGDTQYSSARLTFQVNISSSCVAEGTMITLADGTQKAVETLTGDERLLVWNLWTGAFESAPILFIDSEARQIFDVINLTFSDGTTVKVIDEHGFWDVDLNKYVYLRADANKYIGHRFKKETGEVTLLGVEVKREVTTAWSPVTYGHLCYYVNGMLSMPGGIEGLFNIFEVDPETMKIDEAKYLADIETYGLFAYEEFSEQFDVSEEIFNAVGGQYLKVALGKGILTEEIIANLIARYASFF